MIEGRESKMKQKGVSANFHNVTLMKPFMIMTGILRMFPCRKFAYSYFNSSEHFSRLSESGNFLLVLPALNLGYPYASPSSSITEVCSGWAGTSSPGPCCLQRVWQPWLWEPADAALQEKCTMSCQRNGDIVCTMSCGTWIQVVFYPEPDRTELIQPVCFMQNARENYEILGYLKQSQIHKLVWPLKLPEISACIYF